MTKARDISKLLSTANGKIAGENLDVSFENITDTGTEGTKVASGTSAQRGSTAGQLRFNSTTGLAEYYTGTAFKSIDAPPTISSVGATNITEAQISANYDLSISGSGFSSGATVKFIGNDNTEYASPTVTVNSETSITARVPSSVTNANEPYNVKVTNISGLANTLADAFNINASPSWNTASGNISNTADDVSLNASVSATDPDGTAVSYTVQSGSSLPTGLSLNSSTGAITGTPPDVTSSTTSSFTLEASDGANTTPRLFNIITHPTPDSFGDYPTSASNYQYFEGTWTSNGSNILDLNHTATTFTVPSNVFAIRVVAFGGGSVFRNSYGGGYGGVTDVILRVEPTWKFKAITATGSNFTGNDNGSDGGSGVGGGAGQDSNDNGVGGGGSGFFFAGTGTTLVSSGSTMYSRGVVIAGGAGSAGSANFAGGNGNGGHGSSNSHTGTVTQYSQTIYGASGGNGSGQSNSNGGIYTGQGGHQIHQNGSIAQNGGAWGVGGTSGDEGYSGCGSGSGGGTGAGGAGGYCLGGSATTKSGENATATGGRGSSGYDNTFNTNYAGFGGDYSIGVSMGGNGFAFNSINLGGGGAGGHGASQAGGGFSGGGSGWYQRGGGGGSGCASGDILDNPFFSHYGNHNPSGISINGGNLTTIGASNNIGNRKINQTSQTTGYDGGIVVMW